MILVDMEQKFGVNSIDLQELYDFCELEGETVSYQKGERMECEGAPSQWFGFVTKGCFKYVIQGLSDGKEHNCRESEEPSHSKIDSKTT